jgi:hypothetical protein
VHDVEVLGRELVGQHIVRADLEGRVRELTQHRRVEIGRDHLAVRPGPRAEPGGDRDAAGADLEAPPAGPHATRLEVPDGPRVEDRLERAQALALHGAGVVERVRRLLSRH